MNQNFDKEISNYICRYTKAILNEVDNLIKIPSVSGEKEVAKALNSILRTLDKYGYCVDNYKGIIGIADCNHQQDKCLGIIGHVDVGPAGDGWNYNPFELSIDKGYYFGRGIIDDKGPLILMIHAINFLKEQQINWKYNVRFIAGTTEETSFLDIETYLKNFIEPDYVITPDGDFPVCYGEKGFLRFQLCYKNVKKSDIVYIHASEESNVIPEKSTAVIPKNKINIKKISSLDNVEFIVEDNFVKITAYGKAAHATDPELGINSIAILNDVIVTHTSVSENTKKILKYINEIIVSSDGSSLGINCSDKDFGKLTIAPTQLNICDDILFITFDCRYPSTITYDKIIDSVKGKSSIDCDVVLNSNMDPYTIQNNSPIAESCSKAYGRVTKQAPEFFTMSGSTYAKHFKNAIAFGPNRPFRSKPAWLGSMHEANEGMSKEDFWETFKIYVYALLNLNQKI